MLQPLIFILKNKVRNHYPALFCALFVGLLYIGPYIFFIVSTGDVYRGIPMLATANEDSYLARIQDIVDGHGALGSPVFFEYKNQWPLSPPTGEWLYALPTLVFGISPATVLVVSKFILPVILFLLIYSLMLRIIGSGGWREKLSAIACGLFVVLGYDLIDYRTVLSYLSGGASPTSFLLWSRPVNPILGAIFLFSFLLFVWSLLIRKEQPMRRLLGAGFFLALMFGSYFFSWGIALSVLAVLILLLLFRKEYKTAGILALILPIGAFLSSPYWYASWRASQSPWYAESVLRSGLFLTHYPILNRLLLATLFFFIVAVAADFFLKKRKGIAFQFERWHLFCLALLLGGLWAFSQQLITGRTIWPYHFVQYTIPFSMIVGVAVLHNIIREYSKYIWVVAISATAAVSLVFGVYTQASTYSRSRPYYAEIQNYAFLFNWLNAQKKDCVVFVNEDSQEMSRLNNFITAFTHCNIYSSADLFFLIPRERGLNSYMAVLRLKGVSADAIEEYSRLHTREAAVYLFSNWQGLFGVTDFPDFSDPILDERLKEFPEQYKEFMKKDFEAELKRYRLDFILSTGPLSEAVKKQLPGIKLVKEINDSFIYQF